MELGIWLNSHYIPIKLRAIEKQSLLSNAIIFSSYFDQNLEKGVCAKEGGRGEFQNNYITDFIAK